MKEKLRELVKHLAQRHYSADTIIRAILLPTQVDNTEEIMDKLIMKVQQTKSEKEFLQAIEQMR